MMHRPASVCLEHGCPDWAVRDGRCLRHARIDSRNHAGVSPSRRGLGGAIYGEARRRFAGQPCWRCGAPSDTVGHVIPRTAGGTTDWDNLVPECGACNYGDGARLSRQGGRSATGLRRDDAYRDPGASQVGQVQRFRGAFR